MKSTTYTKFKHASCPMCSRLKELNRSHIYGPIEIYNRAKDKYETSLLNCHYSGQCKGCAEVCRLIVMVGVATILSDLGIGSSITPSKLSWEYSKRDWFVGYMFKNYSHLLYGF